MIWILGTLECLGGYARTLLKILIMGYVCTDNGWKDQLIARAESTFETDYGSCSYLPLIYTIY